MTIGAAGQPSHEDLGRIIDERLARLLHHHACAAGEMHGHKPHMLVPPFVHNLRTQTLGSVR